PPRWSVCCSACWYPEADSEPAESIPVATEPGRVSSSPAWQQVEQEELERWWAEVERRVLAEEPGAGPEPLLDEETLGRMLSESARQRPGREFYDQEPLDREPPGWERPDH